MFTASFHLLYNGIQGNRVQVLNDSIIIPQRLSHLFFFDLREKRIYLKNISAI